MTAVGAWKGPAVVPEAQWYSILTRYRREHKVVAQLQKKGIETFLPTFEEVHPWSDRKKTLQIALFPGYVFARLGRTSSSRLEVLQTEGVLRFVSFGREVVPVPSKQIEDLRRLLAHKVPCSLHAFLSVGQLVRIHNGCLDGLEGILEQKEEESLVISIHSIQQSVAIRIQGYELELI